MSLFLWSVVSVLISVSNPVNDLHKTFQGKKGFQVEFTQEIQQSSFAKTNSQASGSVKFTRPHFLKWIYETPKKKTIEYDGSKLTIEEGSQKEEVKDSGKLNLQKSFSFLWGQADSNVFKIEKIDGTDFRLTPRDLSSANFKYIDVTVKKGLVTSVRIPSAIEGVSELKFKNWKLF
ncbi:MAG: outer membrane lipoprotein carrier protein LolA [Deltaproteobacteria bacterium]|nr:outer membrane lipoprotein carrier protein LolA [Deltaproteobacteria bacterium]